MNWVYPFHLLNVGEQTFVAARAGLNTAAYAALQAFRDATPRIVVEAWEACTTDGICGLVIKRTA